MYATTFSIIRNNFLAFAVLIVFDTLIDLVSRSAHLHLSMLRLFLLLLLTYYAHRAVLFGERFDFASLVKMTFLRQFGKFVWRSICLCILIALIVMILLIPIFMANGSVNIRDNPTAMTAEFGLSLVTILVLWAWLGTWLPATVYGQRSSFEEARSRGKTTFLPVLLDLLVPTAISPLLIFLRGAGIFRPLPPAPLQFLGVADYVFLVVIVLSHALELIVTVLYAVALSRVYLMAEQRRAAIVAA